MRHVVIDTETTGFTKNRLIEVAAMEFHPETGETLSTFHSYVRPAGATVEPAAYKVHGLSDAFLADKPTFSVVAPKLRHYLSDATLYAHNAPFDVRVLNAELLSVAHPALSEFTSAVICTNALAKKLKLPVLNTKLDTLCDHFNVDRSSRISHGALIDCQLLVRVYLSLSKLTPPSIPVAKLAKPQAEKSATKREGWRPGGPWYDDEKESLARLYAEKTPFDVICAKHNRSFVSIVMQLAKQGLMSEEECATLRQQYAAQQASSPSP